MSKDFTQLIKKLTPYAEELTPALVIVLLETQDSKPLKHELKTFLQKNDKLKHSHYLEIIAMAHGYKDYNHLSAHLNKNKAASLKELEERTKRAKEIMYDYANEKNCSQFYKAVTSHDLKTIKTELTQKVILEKKGIAMTIALEYLIRIGDVYVDLFKFILNTYSEAAKAEPKLKANYKTTRSNLLYSLKHDYQTEIAKELLKEDTYSSDVKNFSLICSLDEESVQLVDVYIKNEFDLNQAHGMMGWAINRAIDTKNIQLVKLLIDSGAKFKENSLRCCFLEFGGYCKATTQNIKFANWVIKQMSKEEKELNLKTLGEEYSKHLKV